MIDDITPGQQIPSVTKSITQETIEQFENCGILDRQNIHNNPELARERLGTTYPIASGRMSVAFAAESLRRFFGPEVFNHTGSVNLKFLRPVKGRRHHHRYRRGRGPGTDRRRSPGNRQSVLRQPERRPHRHRHRHRVNQVNYSPSKGQ